MKVIIGCLNSKYVHVSSAPWCLAAGIREFCVYKHEYSILESTINADHVTYANKIINAAPDVISFSCYIWNIEQVLFICKKIKSELPDCHIILGGPEVAYRAADVLMEHPYVDYILSGEGEFCFPKFLDALQVGENIDSVEGLSFRLKDGVVTNAEEVYTQTPPSPYCDDYFEALRGRICYIESSRGCPFRCAFCLSGRVSPFRIFDEQITFRDLLLLANSGSKTIKFVDRTFNADAGHANRILMFIKDNYGQKIPRGVCFHFEIAGDILKESTMEILSKMPRGAVQLEIGMQSFNEGTLSAINRVTNIQKLISNIKRLLNFGNIHIHLDLIAGLTGEGFESFKSSFKTGFELHPHMLQLGFLKLLHGSDMRKYPEDFPCDYSDVPPYEVVSTPWLSNEEIVLLKGCEDALERLYNSGRFLFVIEYLTNDIGIDPFELFCGLGSKICGFGMGLSEYAYEIYKHFESVCDADILKEKIISDLFCTASIEQIPQKLRIDDKRHKTARSLLTKSTREKLVILPKSQKILIVDYDSERDFYGRYKSRFYNIDIIEKSQ